MRSSARARRRCLSSSEAIGRPVVLVANAVSRRPSASVRRNWAPGCSGVLRGGAFLANDQPHPLGPVLEDVTVESAVPSAVADPVARARRSPATRRTGSSVRPLQPRHDCAVDLRFDLPAQSVNAGPGVHRPSGPLRTARSPRATRGGPDLLMSAGRLSPSIGDQVVPRSSAPDMRAGPAFCWPTAWSRAGCPSVPGSGRRCTGAFLGTSHRACGDLRNLQYRHPWTGRSGTSSPRRSGSANQPPAPVGRGDTENDTAALADVLYGAAGFAHTVGVGDELGLAYGASPPCGQVKGAA